MHRRNVIKNLAIATGGLIALPQWMVSCGISDTTVHQASFSIAQQELLAGIADTIIPAGNSIGALAVETDKYLQKIIDDCYEKDVQDNVKKQLNGLHTTAQDTYKKSFSKCNQPQRQEMLLQLSTSAKKEEKDFFSLMKSETIRGFNTSQKVMEDYLHYKVAPGHYYGCVDIKS